LERSELGQDSYEGEETCNTYPVWCCSSLFD
jgi:hypothetical protein